jgi:hypothetical protein
MLHPFAAQDLSIPYLDCGQITPSRMEHVTWTTNPESIKAMKLGDETSAPLSALVVPTHTFDVTYGRIVFIPAAPEQWMSVQ